MGKPLIVVLGAGLGGTIASYEIKAAVKDRADVMTVSDSDTYSFIPSNPWVAVRWREPEAIQVHLPPVFAKRRSASPRSARNGCMPVKSGSNSMTAHPSITIIL